MCKFLQKEFKTTANKDKKHAANHTKKRFKSLTNNNLNNFNSFFKNFGKKSAI